MSFPELEKDQVIFSIRKDGECLGYVESKDGNLITNGELGEETYTSLTDFIRGLWGKGISIDNFYT